MADDLAAFFAKKKAKGSKKNAIRLEEVGQQLESNLRFEKVSFCEQFPGLPRFRSPFRKTWL